MSKILKERTKVVRDDLEIEAAARKYAQDKTKSAPTWIAEIIKKDIERTFIEGVKYGQSNQNGL